MVALDEEFLLFERKEREGYKENEKRLDSSWGRSLEEKGKENCTGSKEEELIPEMGKSSPVVGAEYGSKSGSCLTTGFTDGCHPKTPFVNNEANANTQQNHQKRSKNILKLRILPPRGFSRDGMSFLRSSPMTARFRLGSADSEVTEGLTDLCSNTGLMDLQCFKDNYPDTEIQPEIASIAGIGKKKSLGWAVIPVWIDTLCPKSRITCVKIDVEVHIMEGFEPKFLIGLDTFLEYKIDVCLPTKSAIFRSTESGDLWFPVFCPPAIKFRRVKIRAKEAVKVPPRTVMAIEITSPMLHKMDYLFKPSMFWQEGFPPDTQFANGLLNADTRFIMLKNQSDHSVYLEKGQVIGEAEAILFGGMMGSTGTSVKWNDMTKAHSTKKSDLFGTKPPASVIDDETHGTENILCFDVKGREINRPPRSISEEELQKISGLAKKRQKGERFPLEDLGKQYPISPIPDINGEREGKPDISKDLSTSQRNELSDLFAQYPEAFSDGTTLGKIDRSFYEAKIDLEGPLPPPQQNRLVGPGKRAIIDETIETLLGWDVIEQSNSPTASAVVLVWQNEKWRFCVDFRGLNAVTKGDAYPMLRSDYVFSALADKRYFSMLDAVKGYHQMEIAEKDKPKTAFITHKGLYQFKRLPFGLKNAPAMFQRMMDQLLGSLRWEAALVYIDDIIVFSDTWESHVAHIRRLLEAACKVGLKFHIGKCRFGYAELTVLGIGLSRYRLHTIAEKVKSIRLLSTPKTIGELHRLLGLFSYYRNFISNFAKISEPLNQLKRDRPGTEYNAKANLKWDENCQKSFEELKTRLCSAPILAHPKFDGRPFILYTDASAIAYAAVLCQVWTHQDYNLDENTEEDEDVADIPPMSAFRVATESPTWGEDYISDPVFRQRYKKLSEEERSDKEIWDEEGFRIAEDQTMRFKSIFGERICLLAARLPEALRVSHDVLGHFGTAKTYERLSSIYYRPKLSLLVDTYVKHCPACLTNKTTRAKLPGTLAPIDPPTNSSRIPRAFESVNMDLIVALPKSQGYDAILVVVDRFTKTGIFIPTTSNFTAESIAEVFLERVVGRGFLPSKFITDRDPRLIQSFWKTICKRLKIDHRKTAAWHAQTDGAAERMNQTLEIALRNYVAPRQNDWSKYLFLIELAYNTAKNPPTGFAPFELLYTQPQDPIERLLHPHIPPAIEDVDMNVNESADDMLLSNVARLKDAQEAIVRAMTSQKIYYDRRHRPLPKYKEGDYASIRLDRHPVAIVKRNKLSQQKLPPYKILKVVSGGRAVELDIPPNLSINPIVSIQHLEPAPAPNEDPFERSDCSGEHARRMKVINHRDTAGGTRKYRINWEGLGSDKDEWRTREKVAEEAIRFYERSLEAQAMASSLSTERLQNGIDSPFPIKRPAKGKTIERPILYISRTTKPYEKNYEATELEMGYISWAMMRLRHYVEGSKVILISDHQPLKDCLESAPGTSYSLRIDKFRMLLMPFLDDMEIIYREGKRMTNVDPLSRARYDGDPSGEDSVRGGAGG